MKHILASINMDCSLASLHVRSRAHYAYGYCEIEQFLLFLHTKKSNTKKQPESNVQQGY